jgi:hypothetical protein
MSLMFCEHEQPVYCICCLPLHIPRIRLKHQHAARVCLHYNGVIQQTTCATVVIGQVKNTYSTHMCSACDVYLPSPCVWCYRAAATLGACTCCIMWAHSWHVCNSCPSTATYHMVHTYCIPSMTAFLTMLQLAVFCLNFA